jgi:WD40 repeat protein
VLLYEVPGLAGRIFSLDISTDSRFLVAAAENCMIIVFDCENGEMVFSKRTETECKIVRFDPLISQEQYRFVSVFDSVVFSNTIIFDLTLMSYSVNTSKLGSVSTPYRNPVDAVILNDNLFVSSATGDICIYSLSCGTFRGAMTIPIGPASLLTQMNDFELVAVCCGSNLVVLNVEGDLKVSRVIYETMNQVPIDSVSFSKPNKAFVIHLSDGRIITTLCDSNKSNQVLACTCPVIIKHLLAQGMDTVITAGGHSLQIWSLKSSQILKTASLKKAGDITCMSLFDKRIACGHESGALHVFDAETLELLFEISSCHRGRVSAVCMTSNFCVTGGKDCVVRVWKGASYVTEFTQSVGEIGGICLNKAHTEELVFYNEKRELFFASLKSGKVSKKFNTQKYGNITAMSQALFNHLDWVVVTAHLDGFIVLWDIDYPEPLKVFDVECKVTSLCVIELNSILFGSIDGKVGKIYKIETGPVSLKSNPLNDEPIIQMSSENSLALNGEGLVMVIDF